MSIMPINKSCLIVRYGMGTALAICFAWLLLFPTTGCQSRYAKHMTEVRADLFAGNTTTALQKIEAREQKASAREGDVLELDAAIIELCNGHTKEAEKKLLAVRDHFDELENAQLKKGSAKLLSLWLDDNTQPYQGEDYEKILVRSFLALSNLLQQGNDAQAYAFQIAQKQDEIIRGGLALDPEKKTNPKLAYKQVALGPYIQGILWESTWLNQKDAAAAYRKTLQWAPSFQHGKKALERAEKGVHSTGENGVVYVFTLVGRGPYKEQESAEVTTAALFVADRIFSALGKYSVPPTLAPVPIPVIHCDRDAVGSVGIAVDDNPVCATETVLDINAMARQQFEAIRSQIIARAVVRRVVKKGTLYAAKDIAGVNDWSSLAMDAGGILWEAMETADTRCWALLPAQIQVARLELPAGKHKLALQACRADRSPAGQAYTVVVDVPLHRNTYVLANFPGREPIGKIVVSQ